MTRRQGLIGNYDYAFLFRPNIPFMAKPKQAAPFFGLNESMPVFLALLLGFQHALAMLAGGEIYGLAPTSIDTELRISHKSTYYYRWFGWCQFKSRPTAVPGINIVDSLWHSIIDSDHKISHYRNSVLRGHWSYIRVDSRRCCSYFAHANVLKGRNLIRDHPRCYGSTGSNV